MAGQIVQMDYTVMRAVSTGFKTQADVLDGIDKALTAAIAILRATAFLSAGTGAALANYLENIDKQIKKLVKLCHEFASDLSNAVKDHISGDVKGKSYFGYAPIGPWLLTADEVDDPQGIDLWLDVNGTRRQTGHTRTQIFGVAQVVSYLSRFMALQPGDVIPTGTPPGVGLGHKPPLFLKAGDVMTLGSTLLGTQTQTVVPYDDAMAAQWRSGHGPRL